jgi:hypothetical protein
MAIKQFQMTGDVYVIIRAINNTAINGINYQVNEVITSFTGDVSLSYNELTSVVTTAKTELARNNVYASDITIVPKQLHDGIYNLIGKRLSGDILVPVISSQKTNANGEIFLNAQISPEGFIIKDSQGAIVNTAAYTVNLNDGVITGLSSEVEYKVYYYQIKTPLASLNFEEVAIPYVKIELVGKGNINNQTKSFLVVIPKAQINGAPQLNFNNDSIINILLNCNIINLNVVELYYY